MRMISLTRHVILQFLLVVSVMAAPFINSGSDGWSVLHVVNGVDPVGVDADFHSTWYQQSLGDYTAGTYDGPAFDAGKTAPFHYGGVNGLSGGTTLITPVSGSRYTSYFIKEIDGGDNGIKNLAIEMLADDGAFVYLNGVLIARDNVADPDNYTALASSNGSESTYDQLTLIGTPVFQPGANLLAVAVHNRSSTSSDLGFDIKISGITDLVVSDTGGWSMLSPLDASSIGYNPLLGDGAAVAADPDFNTTWYKQNVVGSYNGPVFSTGHQAPFAYGGVDGITPNTAIPKPDSGSRGAAYFLYEIDGGVKGFADLKLSMLADDGCFIYLNGKLIGVTGAGFDENTIDAWDTFTTGAANETNFVDVALFGNPVILPGSNLLAISVHQTTAISSDLGFEMNLTGIPVGVLEINRSPYIQKVSTDRGTVRWRTTAPSDTVVKYGDSSTNLNKIFTITENALDHVAEITGLDPETVYYYQIISSNATETINEGATDDYFFKTYPAEKRDTRIWVIGDSGTGNTNQANVYNSYRTHTGTAHTDVWLMLGDNAYNSGTDTEFQSAVFNAYPELLRTTCMWSCIGNHESYTSGGAPYIDIHSFPTNGECGGIASGTERYYSFDHGDIHFVCLDSQTSSNVNDVPGGGGMIDWLETDLKATDKNWIIAYFHHGPYTKGSHDSDAEGQHIQVRKYLTPLLEKYGVDLVLSGHSHCYERSVLLDGHNGLNSLSASYTPATMGLDVGNGSDIGSVDGDGDFQAGVNTDGAYQKPLATGNKGTIYSICGASGKVSNWDDGTSDTVNPTPHPVFIVNLRVLGSMVITVEGNTLNAQYIDDVNDVRDDFTIIKGSTVELTTVDDTFAEFGGDSVAQFNLTRTGATALPLTVNYLTLGSATNGVDYSPTPPGSSTFAAGETSKVITLNSMSDTLAEGSETVQLDLALKYQAAGTEGVNRPLYLLSTNNSGVANLEDRSSHSWWNTHYGPGVVDWNSDTDKDGIPALIEYALGGDPNVNDVSILPTTSLENGMLSLHYSKNNSLNDTDYNVEKSITLLNLSWDTLNIIDIVEGVANPTGIEMHKASTPLIQGNPATFLRLKVDLK